MPTNKQQAYAWFHESFYTFEVQIFDRSDKIVVLVRKWGHFIENVMQSRAIIKFSKDTHNNFGVKSQWIDSKSLPPFKIRSHDWVVSRKDKKPLRTYFLHRIITDPSTKPCFRMSTNEPNARYDYCKFDYLNKYSSERKMKWTVS